MNGQLNQLVKSLLHKETLDQCSMEELQQFADKYPYFGAAHLLLAKKLQEVNTDRFKEQLQKTYLFFHNPLWVEQLLNDTGTAEIKEQPVEKLSTEKESTPEESLESVQTEIIKESAPFSEVVVEKNDIELLQNTVSLAETAGQATAPEPLVNITVHESPATFEQVVINKPVETVQATPPVDLIFEPYHTVDYFASQGIKFKEEEKPADKFSQQLRSFTDWLKTMKKLPVAEIAKSVEAASEKKVEQMAEHSLEDREVITEAMAEVWEKQGNREKAIEVYSKLSLLEPSKSPYFAAKIEILKKEN